MNQIWRLNLTKAIKRYDNIKYHFVPFARFKMHVSHIVVFHFDEILLLSVNFMFIR